MFLIADFNDSNDGNDTRYVHIDVVNVIKCPSFHAYESMHISNSNPTAPVLVFIQRKQGMSLVKCKPHPRQWKYLHSENLTT